MAIIEKIKKIKQKEEKRKKQIALTYHVVLLFCCEFFV